MLAIFRYGKLAMEPDNRKVSRANIELLNYLTCGRHIVPVQ
jgi:hypothetical protein